MLAVMNKVRYGKAFLSLVNDPEKTDKIFDMADAMMSFPNSSGRKLVLENAMAQEGFKALHQRMYLPGDADLDKLIEMPVGTLGYEYAAHMKKYNLSVDFYRAVAPTDALKYFALRMRQTHDIWHVLTGYNTTVRDELALQAFVIAQTRSGISVSILAAGMLSVLRTHPGDLIELMDGVVEGFQRGKKAEFLLGFAWEELWGLTLEEARALAGITPRAGD